MNDIDLRKSLEKGGRKLIISKFNSTIMANHLKTFLLGKSN